MLTKSTLGNVARGRGRETPERCLAGALLRAGRSPADTSCSIRDVEAAPRPRLPGDLADGDTPVLVKVWFALCWQRPTTVRPGRSADTRFG